MSDLVKETIEDRRKKVVEDLAYIHDWSGEPDKRRIDGALTLLSDLMAEREIVREQFADYDEMIRREKQRRNPEYQKSLPTADDVVGILKED